MSVDRINDQYLSDQRSVINEFNEQVDVIERERDKALNEVSKKVNEGKINKINRQYDEKKSKLEETKFKKLEELKKRFEKEKRKLGFVKYRHSSGYDIWGTSEEIAHFVKFDTDIESNFKNVSPREFEVYVSNLLSLLGYRTEVTSYGKDFGVDVIAEKDDERTVVQVKKYAPENKVSNAEVQNLLGSMWRFNAQKAIFATSSDYTDSAREQAENAPIELWDFDKIKKLSLVLLISGNELSYGPLGDSWEIYDEFEKIQTITCPYCEKETAVDRNKCKNCDRIVIPSVQLFNQLAKPLKYLMNELFVIDSNKITYKNDYQALIKYIGELEESVNGLEDHLTKYIHFFENELQVALLDRNKVNGAARNLHKLYLKQMELFKEFRAINVPSSVTNLHKIVDDVHWKNMVESFKMLDQIKDVACDPEKFLKNNVLTIKLDYNPIINSEKIESELAILKVTLKFVPGARRPFGIFRRPIY